MRKQELYHLYFILLDSIEQRSLAIVVHKIVISTTLHHFLDSRYSIFSNCIVDWTLTVAVYLVYVAAISYKPIHELMFTLSICIVECGLLKSVLSSWI